jgi:hypothetical protein
LILHSTLKERRRSAHPSLHRKSLLLLQRRELQDGDRKVKLLNTFLLLGVYFLLNLADAASVKRTPSSVLLGGKRGGGKRGNSSNNLTLEEEERRRFEEAQSALSRPIKPIPLIPDEPREDDSDDLEEESSEGEERAIPANLPPPPKYVPLKVKPVPVEPPHEEEEEGEEGEGQQREQSEEEEKQDETGLENIESVMYEIELASEREDDRQNLRGSRLEDLLPLDLDEENNRANDSVMDWEGLETGCDFELGEEVSEKQIKEQEKQWKRPPSMLFKITRK